MKQSTVIVLCLLCIVTGIAIGYLIPDTMPVLDIHKKGASVLVLSCIDPRFIESLSFHLMHNKQVGHDYDLFTLAGASLGVQWNETWKEAFFDHVRIAINIHTIKEIWCVDHLDCGMYKLSLEMESDLDSQIHAKYLLNLKQLLKAEFPELMFRGFVIETDGFLHELVQESVSFSKASL